VRSVTKLNVYKLENYWQKISYNCETRCKNLVSHTTFLVNPPLSILAKVFSLLCVCWAILVSRTTFEVGNVFFLCKKLFLFQLTLLHLIFFQLCSCLAIHIDHSFLSKSWVVHVLWGWCWCKPHLWSLEVKQQLEGNQFFSISLPITHMPINMLISIINISNSWNSLDWK
jgi:hypothetical protein